ncbi:MAG: tyrosine-type recombinase/integrase [Synergistaceae bacterium]|nr:tyrosine-type recombinase/integrase [Synergistaceae bacterium]
MNVQNNMTAAQLMEDRVLEKFFLSAGLRPRSVEDYTRGIKTFCAYLADQGVVQPRREHILAYRDFLIKAGKKPSTIHSYIIPLRVFFRWLACEGIYDNIADHIKAPDPSNDAHRRDALTARQTLNLLNAIDRSSLRGLRNYAMLTLMVVCGLRCVEVSRAKVGDFAKRGNDTVLYVYGKGRDDSRTEYVRLPINARRALRTYLKERGRVERDAPLFACTGNRHPNGPLSTRIVSKIVKDALRSAGYNSDRLCAHSLRHTAVTLALKGGEKLEAVKEFARHINVNTTLIYSHAIDRERSTCTRTIERAIFGVKRRQ